MKIALCISGQIRICTFKKSYDSIYNSIIKYHNPDIFIHSWLDDGLDGKELCYKTYNPKKYIIEENSPKKESDTNYNYKSMFKSIFESNKLKTQYEIENNFIYDVVIRCRFDMMLNEIPDFSIYNTNKLNAKNVEKDGMLCINDIFAFGKSEIMNVWSDTSNHIDSIIIHLKKNRHIISAESILTQHLNNNNISNNNLNIWFDLTRHVK